MLTNARTMFYVGVLVSLSLLAFGGLALAAPPDDTPPATLSKGGKLYDNWWKTAGVASPKGDQTLWATQTTNTRKGLDTWRCKECHGWDYLGKDGAYGSGSHKTGFIGVAAASKSKTQTEIVEILKGSSNPGHSFAAILDDASISALASFVKDGVVQDLTQYVDYSTKKPIAADAVHGKQLYENTCVACHGSDGRKLNFGSNEEPEYVGTVAAGNPQEFLHKVRFGQPGTAMPSGAQMGWSITDAVDVMAHAQTLPTKAEVAAPIVARPAAVPQVAAPPATQLPRSGESSLPGALVVLVGLVLAVAGWATRKVWGRRSTGPLG